MRLGFEPFRLEIARGSPAAHFGVVVLVITHRRSGIGHVRRMHKHVAQLAIGILALLAHHIELLVDGAHTRFCLFGLFFLTLGHHLPNGLRCRVALGLQPLFLHNGRPALFVEP